MSYLLLVSVGVGAVLLFLLAAASANTPLFAQHYPLLLGLNAVLVLGLLALVGYQLVTLWHARRAKVFGSLLTFRLVLMFALVALVPGALVYTVSLQFLAKSIESWFDVRVENALEGGINLGRAALDNLLVDLRGKATSMALELSDQPLPQQSFMLNRMREQSGVSDALLVSGSGKVIATSSRDLGKLLPELPTQAQLRQARQARSYGAVEGAERALSLRVIVPLAPGSLGEELRFLQLTQPVPGALAANAESVQSVYRAYKELSLSRDGLRDIYLLTLTLTLLLALFSAIALAFVLSRRLSGPLAELAQGTQAVARGDFSRRVLVQSRDELGILTKSFNSMTSQLEDARTVTEASRAELETTKTYLENILANLSAGVLVFDAAFALATANHSAGAILGQDISQLSGRTLDEWTQHPELAATIRDEFRKRGEAAWQQQLELPGRGQVLLLRGSQLPTAGGGYIVVFDDISQLVQAQRASAWGEVARRLAHEIKNPLTPIQLSAERLQMKLAGKLAPDDMAVLDRATETIVNQVTSMKNMVDDFRDYARMPTPVLGPLDLNRLVGEVLGLYGHTGPAIDARLALGLPAVSGDTNQMRQVIHNLLQNAQDALVGIPDARIELRTELVGNKVLLVIGDNGSGFPENIMQRAFEPYVTTKPKGTGLGLAIVKKIVDEHHGTISIENRTEGATVLGAQIRIVLPLAQAA
ncbi:MAG: ATP-binding protein [Proteobacteria bacterium]|nr:ATP-binding protein [Pseudomonadota bacterium]